MSLIAAGWYRSAVRARRPEASRLAGRSGLVFAVRVDWPDGTHEFFGPMATVETAWTQSGRVQRFWRQGPIRPLRVAPVTTSVNDFDLHRSRAGCKSPDCPVPPAAAGRETQR